MTDFSIINFSEDAATNQWAFWAFLDARKCCEESLPRSLAAKSEDKREEPPAANPWQEQIDAIRELLNEAESNKTTLDKLNSCRKLFTLLLEDRYQEFIAAYPKFERALVKKIGELREDTNGILLDELFCLLEGKIQERKPKKPLTSWQLYVQKTGRLLTDNGVELHPGVKDDVRLLSVFCSAIRREISLTNEQIVALARSWASAGGRAGLSTPEAARVWFSVAIALAPRA